MSSEESNKRSESILTVSGTVIAAIISALAVIAAASFYNWDKLFPTRPIDLRKTLEYFSIPPPDQVLDRAIHESNIGFSAELLTAPTQDQAHFRIRVAEAIDDDVQIKPNEVYSFAARGGQY